MKKKRTIDILSDAMKATEVEKRYTTEQPAEVKPHDDAMIRLLATALIKQYRIRLPHNSPAITELQDSDGSKIMILCHWNRKAVVEDVR